MKWVSDIENLQYELSVGVYGSWYSLPDAFLDPDRLPPYPINDLTGYAAVGAFLDKCDGTVLQALSGSQAAPNVADKLKFFVGNPEWRIEADDGTTFTRTTPGAHGLRIISSTVPTGTGWYYINLVAPGGLVMPFKKGAVTLASCEALCC